MNIHAIINKTFSVAIIQLLVFTSASAKPKPNVLFIAIDDLNDWVGCLGGHPQTISPNIDELASKGLLFTNAHCQAPISGPSRASIMTGLFPSTSGNYFHVSDGNIKKSNDVAGSVEFLPDYFEKYGYKTMGVGKIYHNGDKAETFDEFGGVFLENMYGPTPETRFKYDPTWFDDKVGGTQTDWGVYPENDSILPDYKSAQWAISKLKENHKKPFFLAVGFIRPHVPWYVPQKWFDMFSTADIITPPYNPNDFDDIPEMGVRVSDVPAMPTTEWLIETNQWKEVVRAYLACIAFVDEQVGKVLEQLNNSSYADNTIVILWSDHGYHLGEKNRFAKQALWERNTRVPLIIRTPDMKQGKKTNAPVQLIDMYPTLVELCGLPEYQLAEGKSLLPLIKNPRKKWNHTAKSVYGINNIAVRNERYRLIQYEDNSLELYDLKKDPNEWVNLAEQKKYKKIISILRSSIPQGWADSSQYGNPPNSNYFNSKYRSEMQPTTK